MIRKAIYQAVVRAEVLRRLPFDAEIRICRSRDLIELASWDPFRDGAFGQDVGRFVSALAKRPWALPALLKGS